MADEYNPMEEVGLSEDRQFITSCQGIISSNNNTRELCARYIRNGGRVFDVLSKYEEMNIFPMKAGKEGASRELMRTLIPILKANGVTDHAAYSFSKDNLKLVPGAERTMKYLNELEPCFINTGALDHHMMTVTEAIGFPMTNVNCSQASFDAMDIPRQEAKELREMAGKIADMDPSLLPEDLSELETRGNERGWKIIESLDAMFLNRLPDMEFFPELAAVVSVGANEKSYALLEIRRQSSIDFDSTFYAGSGPTDHQVMDIVKDAGGLALSFNGCTDTVRNCDIAVISSDMITMAVLAAEFYNEGIEAVHTLAKNWERQFLKDKEGPDRYLLDTLLATYPKKLPEVFIVNNDNVDDVAKKSETYRKKISAVYEY